MRHNLKKKNMIKKKQKTLTSKLNATAFFIKHCKK